MNYWYISSAAIGAFIGALIIILLFTVGKKSILSSSPSSGSMLDFRCKNVKMDGTTVFKDANGYVVCEDKK